MSVPKLRFKEFDGAWPELKLKDLVKSLDAGVSVNSEDIEPQSNEYSVLKTSCISSGYFDVSERKRVLQVTEITRLKEPVLENSILMSRMNTPLLVGMNAYVSKAPERTFLPDRLWQLKINEEKTFTRWLAFYLGSDQGLNQIRDLASGTSNSMKNITKSDVMNLGLFVPSKEEQTKIASFLSSVDEKISQLTQKHQLLSQYKQGMMQKLFSQQIRFKADDGSEFGEWEYYKLGELTTLITKGTTPTSLGGKFENSGINFIKIESLSSDGKFLLDKFAYIDEVTHNKLARSQLENEDILFSIAGALGRVAIISNDYLPANTNQALAIIRLRNKNVTQYIYYFLNSDYVKKIIETESVQLAQANFSLGQLSDLDIVLPCHEEQTKIANFLSAIDQKIEVTSQQIEQAKQWKKGLLQQMFV